jgi:hypothetical protein
LRPCNVRDRRQRGSARGQLQKLPAQNLLYKLLNSLIVLLDHLVGSRK